MNVKKEFIRMLATTAERKEQSSKTASDRMARKEAGGIITSIFGSVLPMAFGGTVRLAGATARTLMAGASAYLVAKWGVIPAIMGYLGGHALAESTSPSKYDLRAIEYNTLADEMNRQTEELKKLPSVTRKDKDAYGNKDMSWIN